MILSISSSLLLLTISNNWSFPLPTLSLTTLILSNNLILSTWSPQISPQSHLDLISSALILITLWIIIIITLSSWANNTLNNQPLNFISISLILTTTLIITFSIPHLLGFYILFEISLLPIIIIVIIWGGQPERLNASIYLLIYTIVASLPLLIAITTTINAHYSFNNTIHCPPPTLILPISLTLAFIVNLPIYSLHLWLPNAHTEAPVAGSIMLASVILNLGSYGLLRISALIPTIIKSIYPIVIPLTIIGAATTTFICLRQHDLNEIIAYASVSHISLIAASLITNSHWAFTAIILINISHGITSSQLFSTANALYENIHSRALAVNNGTSILTPPISIFIIVGILINGGAPPFINLLSEIIILTPILNISLTIIIPLFFISFISIVYSIFIYISISHGNPSNATIHLSPNLPILISSWLHTILITPLILTSQLLIL